MHISLVTVFKELYSSFLNTSLIARAQHKGLVTFSVTDFFSAVSPKERIDAPTFGHGAGMLLKPEVVEHTINAQQAQHGTAFKIFFSPHGTLLTQKKLKSLAQRISQESHVMLIAGRYEGMDARVEQVYADEIISIGDYVLMGGDLPAMVLLEGLLRLMPGVVAKQESVDAESFSGPFVDHPEYTEPVVWHELSVPDVIRSGDHARIARWRQDAAIVRTLQTHFDWIKQSEMTDKQKNEVYEHLPGHYAVLMHSQVLIGPEGNEGTTSVTSIDIHDIARSARTYGLKNFFVVTPLVDQRSIVNTLLDFWKTGAGIEYNRSRHQAVKQVELCTDLDQVIAFIEKKEGTKPLLVATSARSTEHPARISYHDQSIVWAQNRPVLFIFGTGQGLSPELVARTDYLLLPVEGLTTYNHLSVRSAVAIILDRWLGLNIKP